MHVITGGAFNGKAAWVKEFYQLNNDHHHRWISAYKGDPYPFNLAASIEKRIVLEGVEQWMLKMLEKDKSFAREFGRRWIASWRSWEQTDPDRKLIIIGTDISKGIVPVEQKNRIWRDMTGWFYQDLVEISDRVDIIWYGVNKNIK